MGAPLAVRYGAGICPLDLSYLSYYRTIKDRVFRLIINKPPNGGPCPTLDPRVAIYGPPGSAQADISKKDDTAVKN